MYVSAGTKLYGLVRKVGDVSIVTRFVMLQEMPLFPLESRYLIGEEHIQTTGIPLLAQTSKSINSSIPLARLDWLSVVFGYIRPACLAMVLLVVVGATVCGTVYLSVLAGTVKPVDRQLDAAEWLAIKIAVAGSVIAAIIGQATYLVPSVKRRDRRIRQCCGEMLGICIDPAFVVPAIARQIEQAFENSPGQRLDQTKVKIDLPTSCN